MSDTVIAELLARVSDLERGAPPPVPRRTRRRGRVALAVVALAGLLLVPVGVFANHQFTDVPTSSTFHASISKARLAGITAGCSTTKYCPNDEVTRGQMAAFLARSAGRAQTAYFIDELDTDFTELAEFDIKAAEATGGSGAVMLVATVSVITTDATECPCTAMFWIESENSLFSSFTQFATVTETNIEFEDDPTTYGIATTSLTVLLPIETGITDTVYLVGAMVDGSPLQTFGEMVGTVALFDGTGGNVVLPTITQGGPTSGPGSRGHR